MLATLLLPPPDFGARHSSRLVLITLAVVALWALYTDIAVPLYYYRSWRRLRIASNKTEYALWLSFETLLGVGLLSVMIYVIAG